MTLDYSTQSRFSQNPLLATTSLTHRNSTRIYNENIFMYKYPLMQRESMGLFHVSFSNPVEILWPRTWAFDVNYVASTHSLMRNV